MEWIISTHILTKRMTNEIHTMLWEEVIFQLTSSRRGWHGGKKCNLCVYEFQLTSSRRGWQLKLRNNKQIKYFNSHPHEEDDIGSCPICIATRIFQLTSSRRGWPVSLILHHAHTIFQLTSSRRGWHWPDTNTFRTGISTHILTKRMTWRYKRASDHRSISTHILTKRMTITPLMKSRIDVFQLTSSRRGWLCVDTICSRIA